MNDGILLALAAKWEREAAPVKDYPAVVSQQELVDEPKRSAARETKRNCASALRDLVKLLGDAV